MSGGFPFVDLAGLNLGGNLNANNNMNANTSKQAASPIYNMNMQPQLNLFDNNIPNMPNMNTFSFNPASSSMNAINLNMNQSPSQSQAMKEIFKNSEITIYSQLTKSPDKQNINGFFFVSNNTDKLLSNVKVNLSVKKIVNCKVISTNATVLEPRKSLGIKKVR